MWPATRHQDLYLPPAVREVILSRAHAFRMRSLRARTLRMLRGAFIPNSRCSSVILVDQPTESIDADDCAFTPIPGGGSRLRRLEREAAVRSFFVVVPQVLSEDPLQMALPEDQEVVQALAAHRLHEALGKGVRLRGYEYRRIAA